MEPKDDQIAQIIMRRGIDIKTDLSFIQSGETGAHTYIK
jgi:hypothetical protein